jgi:ribosomal-protein-alanine N-acetyltransferase
MAFLRPSLTTDPLPVLRAGGVVLRTPQMQDYPLWSHLRGISRPHLAPFEPQWAFDELTRPAFRDRVKRYHRDARTDQGYAFFIFTAVADELVGGITLSNIRRGVSQAASVGYWIGQPRTRRGYAGSALAAVSAFAFEELRLHRLEAACMPANIASLRTLERGRFRREGIAVRYLKIANRWEDHVLFALTIEEWLEARQ